LKDLEQKIKLILSDSYDDIDRPYDVKNQRILSLLHEYIIQYKLDSNIPYLVSIYKEFYPTVNRFDNLKDAIEYLASELCFVEDYNIPDDDYFFYLSPILFDISWENIMPLPKKSIKEND
jgi:hypothetical protein